MTRPGGCRRPPTVETFTYTHRVDDFFAGFVFGAVGCGFPVAGTWAIREKDTTFSTSTGEPRVLDIDVTFEGTQSNPASGRTIADAGHLRRTIELAPDGSIASPVRCARLTPEAPW